MGEKVSMAWDIMAELLRKRTKVISVVGDNVVQIWATFVEDKEVETSEIRIRLQLFSPPPM